MKKIILFIFITILTFSCSSIKKTQKAINYGNYDEAISIALKHLKNSKTKKSNQPFVVMLEDAFKKGSKRDLGRIKYLKKENNPEGLKQILNLYLSLKNRQERIKPLLPLTNQMNGKIARFHFNDYSTNIISIKNKLSDYLYNKANFELSNAQNKYDYRKVYEELSYLEQINPNYKNTRLLFKKAHFKGTNFVLVTMQNTSNKIIPIRLKDDLLNFDTYKLNDFWTIYQSHKNINTTYNYQLDIDLRNIIVSPEQIFEKQINKEIQIKDGLKYLKDKQGNIVKDSLGHKIKIDKFKTASYQLDKTTQFKSVKIIGQINFIKLSTNQLIKTFPLESDFIFKHQFAAYSGDRDALDKQSLNLINARAVPFPSDEQMIYDTSNDLKNKIKNIIVNHNL